MATDNLNSDGQIGMDDHLMTDKKTYDLVASWHDKQQRFRDLESGKAEKVMKDAKDLVLEKLSLDATNVERYRFQLDGEADAPVYTLTTTPPKEPTTPINTTRHNTHSLKLQLAE